MKEQKGFLITVEGIDGSGKSTLVESLHGLLKDQGHKVIITKEPGKTQLGQKIRNILQQEKNLVCDKAEFLLFAADRAQHIEEVIVPALNNGNIIISDRMADSSLAYQGYGRGLDIELIKTINAWCMNGVEPDLTIYVDIDEKTALERIYKRKELLTAFEKESTAFWKRIKKGFGEILKSRSNVIWLDGKLPADEVTQQAYNAIQKLI